MSLCYAYSFSFFGWIMHTVIMIDLARLSWIKGMCCRVFVYYNTLKSKKKKIYIYIYTHMRRLTNALKHWFKNYF